jgi:3beta-hydroxy-delta5-steroid dehydrogenase/steroid delta-isomerase
MVGKKMARAGDVGPVCLVTGGSGFFGRALVRRLVAEGMQVRVLDVARHADLDPRAELMQADLRDVDAVHRAVRGVGTVFHTAALINLSGVADARTRKTVFDVNVGATQTLLDACRALGVPRFVYTSSNNVVFDREIVDGDESEPYAQRAFDLYTLSKIESERRVLAAGKQGTVKTCALRPGGIWGPYAGGVMIDKVLQQIAKGTFIARVGSGSLADNTHVDNLADAQWLSAHALLERPERVSGEAYFITDGEPMDPVEWFRPLVEALGESMPERRIPGLLMYGLAYGLEWLHRLGGPHPLVTRVEVLKVTRAHSFRIDKAREHLGYEPRIKSAEGLLACVPYARAFLAQRGRSLPMAAE